MKNIKIICVILLSFLISSHSISQELDYLFVKLKNADNFSQAENIEKKIWNIWITNGSKKT